MNFPQTVSKGSLLHVGQVLCLLFIYVLYTCKWSCHSVLL